MAHIFEGLVYTFVARTLFFSRNKEKDYIVAVSITVTRPIFHNCKYLYVLMSPVLHKPGWLFIFLVIVVVIL